MSENITHKAIIVDNTFFSIGFPEERWDSLIHRGNYLALIDDYFLQGNKIIFIQGAEDSGKTTLCAQYARSKVDETISVFFNPLNNLDYRIEFYCSNVVYQIKNILKESNDNFEDKFVSQEEYQIYIFQLRKFLKKGNKKINIVIDGLEGIINDRKDFILSLFSLIPIGHDIFRFVITGSQADFYSTCPNIKSEDSKQIALTGFSAPEIINYLNLTSYTDQEINELFKITKGFPGRLKTLKRLISTENYSINQISSSTTYRNWIELDCESVETKSSVNKAILSLISLSDKSFSVEQIADICSLSVASAEQLVDGLKIIERSSKYVAFVSNEHRKYFANIFRSNKKTVDDLLINYYANTKTINSLIELPKLYAQNSNWLKIIDTIDDEYVEKVIQATESLTIINDNLKLGLEASEKTHKYTEMWRYSIESSIVNELDNYLFWESEIKARISIKDFAGAISLAENALLKIDRLRLLALIARREKELNKHVDEDLIKLIQELYETTDIISVGDKIYDIVADLIYAIPNLAIEMIEKSSGNVSEKILTIGLWQSCQLLQSIQVLKKMRQLKVQKEFKQLNASILILQKKFIKQYPFWWATTLPQE